MKIYNEKTNKIESFETIKKKEVNMYVCGPTVYSDIHIGNARPIIFFDLVYRFLSSIGYDVTYVSNITDVDDKIINKAIEKNISEQELVDINCDAFRSVLERLNISPYYKQPKVTEYMNEIIEFIEKLIKLDFAYVIKGDVYFKVDKVKEYGVISKTVLKNLQIGSRIEANLDKQSPFDFTLWKETCVGVSWDSPWSKGRPGWHTECVVMIREIFGNQIDIHGGGMDLKFPHHENENAQSSACGSELAKYWMHNGFININDTKMSKSIGNVMNLKDMLDLHGPNVVRLMMFQTNYRQPINMNEDFIEQTKKIVARFFNVYVIIKERYQKEKNYNDFKGKIIELLEDDFNVSNVITLLLELSRGDITSQKAQAFFYAFEILGLEFEVEDEAIPNSINLLIEKRNLAKK
ncbi:MAG: cysteine--tRNA ligase, partial [Mycoplasmatales bacterium]